MADERAHLRAADADRQAVADRLRAALDEGRLDFHEYDARLADAYAAKTYGELDCLTVDLPAVAPVAPVAPAAPAGPAAPAAPAGPAAGAGAAGDHGSFLLTRWLLAKWDDYLLAVIICVVIWVMIMIPDGDRQGWWWLWVAGPWGAYLAYETIKGLSTGEPQRWAAKQAAKRAKRAAREVEAPVTKQEARRQRKLDRRAPHPETPELPS